MGIAIVIGLSLFLLMSGYALGLYSDSKKFYKLGYTEAINDLYNKSVPKYILKTQDNGEVHWVENNERKTYEELQEGDL